MSPGVNFDRATADRIERAVLAVERSPLISSGAQRHRAGGLGRLSLWEVTEVQTTPKTVTLQRVDNSDMDLITIRDREDIAYDPDAAPSVGDRGLVIRLGDGVLFFFRGGGGGGTVSLIKITSGGPGDTYIGNVYGAGKDATASETGVTIKILQIAVTDTVPSGTWLIAHKFAWAGTDKGDWDADGNAPTLASGVGSRGDYYKVTVEGTTDLDGIDSWAVDDYAIFDGTEWTKGSDPADAIFSDWTCEVARDY